MHLLRIFHGKSERPPMFPRNVRKRSLVSRRFPLARRQRGQPALPVSRLSCGAARCGQIGSVERDHAVLLRGQINQTAALKVFDHASIAMQQDQRRSCPALKVVQSHTVDCDKSANWRVHAFGFLGEIAVHAGPREPKPQLHQRLIGCAFNAPIGERGAPSRGVYMSKFITEA